MSVKPLYCDIRDVGKTIASTKKLFIWKFSLDGKDYTIELYNSMLSGKKKIAQNGQVVYENNSYQGAFQFPFTIGRNSLSIVQHGDRYELRINNQSFEHIMNQRNTQDHFRSDFRNEARQSPQQDRYGGGGGASRGSRRQADAVDEDEELRRAIELSKQTAKKEEKERAKRPAQQSKPADDSDDDFGFDKFATYNKPAAGMGGDDINDFDFNSVIADSKKQEPKDDFNFGFDDAQPKSSAAPAKQSNDAVPDLMDLLGGDMPAQTTQNQQPVMNMGNNDFFGGANQQQPVSDPFSSQPVNTQQQTMEKPKFVPNPVFQSQMMPGSQANMMYQQQFQGGGQFGQPQQQQYFQTGMPQQQQQFGMGGMQMGMQTNMMGQQPNMMGGAQMGGMPQQQQMQGQSPFDAFGSSAPQQQAAPQQQESTPFDLF